MTASGSFHSLSPLGDTISPCNDTSVLIYWTYETLRSGRIRWKQVGNTRGPGKGTGPHSSVIQGTSIHLWDAGLLVGKPDTHRFAMKMDMLPGDVLLQIFDFCHLDATETLGDDWWHALVHVCQRWRQLMFALASHFNLQLLCNHKTHVRKKLDFWPNFPIVISDTVLHRPTETEEDNLLTAFKHSDRVCNITLCLHPPLLEKVAMMMLKPFPALTHLQLTWTPFLHHPFILSSGFLGGSASSLQALDLTRIFPSSLPSLLSSTNNLVALHLHFLSMTNHVSSEAIVTGLAAITRLKHLTIEFHKLSSDLSLPTQNSGIQLAQTILPALTQFHFKGSYIYLKSLITQLNTHQLVDLSIEITQYMDHPLTIQVPEVFQFISHVEGLKLAQFRHAHSEFHDDHAFIHFNNAQTGQHIHLTLKLCRACLEHQVQLMGALFSQAAPIISTVHHFSISLLHKWAISSSYEDHAALLGLLQPFLTVEALHVEGQFTDFFPPMLNGLSDELVAVVLPALSLLNLEGKPLRFMKQLPFITKRQLIGCPLTIVNKKEDLAKAFDKVEDGYL